jgi:hypothetical protein
MHPQRVRARPDEGLHKARGVLHHEVYIERQARHFGHRLHDGGADGQVRNEATVHHIDVNPVRAGLLGGAHLFRQPPEIGRENRGGNHKTAHDRTNRTA